MNLKYTLDFDGIDFILKNGQRLPVSRSLSKAARLVTDLSVPLFAGGAVFTPHVLGGRSACMVSVHPRHQRFSVG